MKKELRRPKLKCAALFLVVSTCCFCEQILKGTPQGFDILKKMMPCYPTICSPVGKLYEIAVKMINESELKEIVWINLTWKLCYQHEDSRWISWQWMSFWTMWWVLLSPFTLAPIQNIQCQPNRALHLNWLAEQEKFNHRRYWFP